MLYGDNNNWFAAWAYWQLKLYGHDDVRILNGGRKYWLDNGLPLIDRRAVATTPTGYQLPEPDFALRAFRDDILPRLGDAELALVDVRSPAEFNGEIIAPPGHERDRPARRAHPGRRVDPVGPDRQGGRHVQGRRGPRARCTRRRASRRTRTSSPTAGSASARSTRWFVLHELLGYERVRNYDGSWTEYGSLIGVPIEKPVAGRRRRRRRWASTASRPAIGTYRNPGFGRR